MSTTVKELSQKLDLKRNSIEMRMSQIPNFRKKYAIRKGNRLIINDKGGDLICNLYKRRKHHVNKSVKSNVNDKVNDYRIDSLSKMLKQERRHNAQLQKQLDHVNKSNTHLGNLLDHQQQLQLTAQGIVKRLRGQIKRLKTIPGQVDKSTENDKNNAKKAKKRAINRNNFKSSKTGFWRKFFNKL